MVVVTFPVPPSPLSTTLIVAMGVVCACLCFFAMMIAYPLLMSIVYPTIVSYPWMDVDRLPEKQRRKDKETVVVMAGSYNPPHRGHLAMFAYLSERYGEVIVVIGVNPNKTYKVSPDERVRLLQSMLTTIHAPNVRVEAVDGYIWRYAKRHDAGILFRGIRGWERDGDDERRLQILNTWGPVVYGPLARPIPTVFLEGSPKYNHISSTLVRDLCSRRRKNTNTRSSSNDASSPSISTTDDDDISKLVPEIVADDIRRLYGS